MIITLLLQGRLHIGNDLIERRGVVAHINRPIVWIIGSGRIVAPGRIPISSIPVVPPATDQAQVVVMGAPPALVVPLGLIRSKGVVLGAVPILGRTNSVVLVELRAGDR